MHSTHLELHSQYSTQNNIQVEYFLLRIGIIERECEGFDVFVHLLQDYHHKYVDGIHILRSKAPVNGGY